MVASTALAFLISAFALSVNAEVTPSEPGPGTVYRQGQTCRTIWNGDQDGKYGKMSIQLMTGDNWNMVHLDTVGENLDGNKDGKLEFPCPEVEPYSAIYFFQYSAAGAPLTWATRFAIADKDGKTVPPSETTQPNGDKIPWGTGKLVDASNAKPPPSYIGSETQPSGSTQGPGTDNKTVTTSGSTTSNSRATTTSTGASTERLTTTSTPRPTSGLNTASPSGSSSGAAAGVTPSPNSNGTNGAEALGLNNIQVAVTVMFSVFLFL